VRVAPVVLAAALTAALLAGSGSAAQARKLRVTFVGDSVSASIDYTAAARARLERGLAVRLDLAVCRRLVQRSCTYHGVTPPSALNAVETYGRSLGDVLVVKVGYNESAHGYRQGIDEVMREALREGALGVVWVTLRETRAVYHWTNIAIRTAAKRWPELVVADWNRHSRGEHWFRRDGLHLNAAGATALATFLRPYVFRAAGGRSAAVTARSAAGAG
jgi:hypothetical protein